MIRVVGANPAMDRIATWSPVRLGEVNRASRVSVVPGGKGFNVARAVARLGGTAVAYGFLGGHVGEALREMIVADGVIDRHTLIAAGTRVCFIVVEPEPGRSTVLNEPGPEVTTEEADRLLDVLRADCAEGDVVALSGSLPDSVPASMAGEIVAIARAAGARTVIDIHGQAARVAVSRRPWMVKCNRDELLGLIEENEPDRAAFERHRARSRSGLAHEMQGLREGGIETVVVTLGEDGALVADDTGVRHVTVPRVEVANATGSGDLLLAGIVMGVARGDELGAAVALGAACGAAGATNLLPELPPDFEPDRWLPRIGVTWIEAAT
jgi:1-phosphofructokinase family hexose kinase